MDDSDSIPLVVAGADSYLSSRDVRDRCELIAGDFFESVPGGGDVYLLKLILHDWDDGQASAILESCRAAMRPGARLIVIDALLPEIATDGVRERSALMLDLHMHVLFGARERSQSQLRRMLESARFKVAAVVPTAPPWTIVAEAIG